MAVVALVERTTYLSLTGTRRGDRDKTLDVLAAAVQAGIRGTPTPA